MTTFTIYRIFNDRDTMQYVGQTKNDVRERFGRHLQVSHKLKDPDYNSPLSMAIREYGTLAFDYEILAICSTQSEADALESRFIEQFDTFRRGYNRTIGSPGIPSFKHSADTKRQMSVAQQRIAADRSPEERAAIADRQRKHMANLSPRERADRGDRIRRALAKRSIEDRLLTRKRMSAAARKRCRRTPRAAHSTRSELMLRSRYRNTIRDPRQGSFL